MGNLEQHIEFDMKLKKVIISNFTLKFSLLVNKAMIDNKRHLI